jgi:hypothetical protein
MNREERNVRTFLSSSTSVFGESISLPSTTCKSKQRAIDVLGLAYFGFTSHRIRAQEKWNPYNKNINFEIV